MNKEQRLDIIIKDIGKAVTPSGLFQIREHILRELNLLRVKPKNIPKTHIDYHEHVHITYNYCVTFFEEHLRPENNLKWLDVIDKLHRIDKIEYNDIIRITRWARRDEFWRKNFLSLVKLRSVDKHGIKYIVVFNEKMKNEENRKLGQSSTSNEQLATTLSKHFDKD